MNLIHISLSRLSLTLTILLLLLISCKKTPTFTVVNVQDPENADYIITPPSFLSLTTNEHGLQLQWDASATDIISGYQISRKRDNSEPFQVISKVDKSKLTYLDIPDWSLIDVEYALRAYYEPESGPVVYSDSVVLKLNNSLSDFSANSGFNTAGGFIFVNLNHDFGNFSTFYLEEKIGDQDFSLIDSLPSNQTTFRRYYDAFPMDSVYFKIYAKNQFTSTKEVITKPHYSFNAPYELTITEQSENFARVTCTITEDEVFEFVLFRKHNTEPFEYEEVERISDCQEGFLIDNLETNEPIEFVILGKIGVFYSDDAHFALQKSLLGREVQSYTLSVDHMIVDGAINSDQNFIVLTTDEVHYYLVDLELSTITKIENSWGVMRAQTIKLIEYNGQSYYTKFKQIVDPSDSLIINRSIDLINIRTGELLMNIPTPEFENRDPTTRYTYYISNVHQLNDSPNILVNTQGYSEAGIDHFHIFNLQEAKYTQALTSYDLRVGGTFSKIASTDKSFLLLDSDNSFFNQYSISDFSLMQQSILNEEISTIDDELSIVKGIPSNDSDDYYFTSENGNTYKLSNGTFIDNPLPDDYQSLFRFQFDVNNLDFRCASANPIRRFEDLQINCHYGLFDNQFSITKEKTNSRIFGFVLSKTEPVVYVFTANGMIKYELNTTHWILTQ